MNVIRIKSLLVLAGVIWFSLGTIGYAAEDCGSEPYGIERNGEITTFEKVPQRKAASLLLVDGPLNGAPPEVRNLRRGSYFHWVGAFINDGLSTWTIVDLDDQELVHVSTRIWDKSASFSKPFDVKEPASDRSNQTVRTWIARDGSRYDRQVITRIKLTEVDLIRFVCHANAEWRSTAKLLPIRSSDTLQSGMYLRWWSPENAVVQEKSIIDQAQMKELINQFAAEKRLSK